MSDDSLENIPIFLTGMSVTSTCFEKKYDVAAASLLKKASDERLSSDAVNLTQQDFASEVYQSEDDKEELVLAASLVPYILDDSNDCGVQFWNHVLAQVSIFVSHP
jgi:hypothetical protein